MTERVVIGNAELWHGDCLEILPTLPDQSVRMIWTDPPYGHNNGSGDLLSRRSSVMRDGLKTKNTPIANDGSIDMRVVVGAMLTEAARILTADSCCCCCCGGGGPSPTFAWLAERMDRDGLAFFHSVIWDKKNPGMGWRYRRQHEMIMVAHRRGGKLSWADQRIKQPNIISTCKPRSGFHPNEKPVDLSSRFVGLHTLAGDVVLDPFMGSGSTGLSCAALGRRFIGIELDRKHFDTACERIERVQAQSRLFDDAAPAPATQGALI